VLLLSVVGIILWRSHRNHMISASVKAAESKPPEVAPSTPDLTVTDPAMASSIDPKQQAANQAKPKDPNAATKPPSPNDKPTKPGETVLQPPPQMARSARPADGSNDGAVEAPALGNMQGRAPNSVISIPTVQPNLAQKVTVSSGVAQGLLVHQVTPRYPTQARVAHVQGTVILQALIGKDGSVQNLRALSGPPLLTQAAVDAVKQWRYKPYYLDGQPVEAETQINVKFTP
jgi:TonB family protein